MFRILVAFGLGTLLVSCNWFGGGGIVTPKETPLPSFESVPKKYPIVKGIADEASGIAASQTMPNYVWLHEDGNKAPNIYLFDNQGNYQVTYNLPLENRDWEDMCISKGPKEGVSYVYLGEIGDNQAIYDGYAVYRFEEPKSITSKITQVDKISFRYPDNKKYDAEALMVDPLTKDIYIVTKREFNVRMYRLPYPQSTTETMTAEFVQTLQLTAITAADISPDGQEIILKSYDAAYYWRRKKDESIATTLTRIRDVGLPYTVEPQGEAICFDKDGKGYFTVSERLEAQTTNTPLYYYSRK